MGVVRKHLLIVGVNYAPEVTGIAPYTTELAERMEIRGWSVTAVTGLPHYPQWKVHHPYRGTIRRWETRNHVRVRRLRHYVPNRQSAFARALYEATFFAHALVPGRLSPANVVVGVVPSLSGGAAAALMAGRYGAPLGLFCQDLVGRAAAQSGVPGGVLASGLAVALERWVVRQADGIAVITEAFRPHLESMGVDPTRIVHVANWSHVDPPRVQERSLMRGRLGWAATVPVVLHAGNMGYKQDLENMVATARLAHRRGQAVHFALMGDGAERARLEAMASDLPNVEFLEPRPDSMFMDVLSAADVLLVNERRSVVDMSLPSKITSYFRSGRPVVAAVAGGGGTERELLRSGGACVTPAGDPDGLLSAILAVLTDPSLAQDLVKRARGYAESHLDRSAQLAKAEAFISGLTKKD